MNTGAVKSSTSATLPPQTKINNYEFYKNLKPVAVDKKKEILNQLFNNTKLTKDDTKSLVELIIQFRSLKSTNSTAEDMNAVLNKIQQLCKTQDLFKNICLLIKNRMSFMLRKDVPESAVFLVKQICDHYNIKENDINYANSAYGFPNLKAQSLTKSIFNYGTTKYQGINLGLAKWKGIETWGDTKQQVQANIGEIKTNIKNLVAMVPQNNEKIKTLEEHINEAASKLIKNVTNGFEKLELKNKLDLLVVEQKRLNNRCNCQR